MPSSARSLHDGPEPSTPKTPPLAPGELATQLRLIPPIVPVADAYRQPSKPKPFFAACAATPCDSMAEKAIFMAYGALAGPNGATWAIKRRRVWYFARQTAVAKIACCDLRTVKRMTTRLMKAGRLRRVQSGRGRLPHAIQVVPAGWNAASRGDSQSPLRTAEGTHSHHNRAFVPPPIKREGGGTQKMSQNRGGVTRQRVRSLASRSP